MFNVVNTIFVFHKLSRLFSEWLNCFSKGKTKMLQTRKYKRQLNLYRLLASKIIIPRDSFRCILRKHCTTEHLKLYKHCSQTITTNDPQQNIPRSLLCLLKTEPDHVETLSEFYWLLRNALQPPLHNHFFYLNFISTDTYSRRVALYLIVSLFIAHLYTLYFIANLLERTFML